MDPKRVQGNTAKKTMLRTNKRWS